MKIVTSSWFTKLPDEVQKIGVSRGTPRGYPKGFRKLMALAPGEYFKTASIPQYKQLYFAGLQLLDPNEIVTQIESMSGGRDAALLCYESPTDTDFCHRAYISCWLYDRLGLEVYEYGHEHLGCAWQHPKLPPQYRLSSRQSLDVTPFLGQRAKDATGIEWEVAGQDPHHPDQAIVVSTDGTQRSVSGAVLRSRFGLPGATS